MINIGRSNIIHPKVVTVVDLINSPKMNDCLAPAITQFPKPTIDKKARQKGAVIVHILVATYMFIGLAIICEDYFVPALTRTSDGETSYLMCSLC